MTKAEVQDIVKQLSPESLQVISSLAAEGYLLSQMRGFDGWFVMPLRASPDYLPTIRCGVSTLKELGKFGLLQQFKDGKPVIRFVLTENGQAVAFEIMD